MKAHRRLPLIVFITCLAILQGAIASRTQRPERTVLSQGAQLNFDAMAERIVSALKLQKGERVLIRFDPDYFAELVPPLRSRIQSTGAVEARSLEYPRVRQRAANAPSATNVREFEQLLDSIDVYLWLPFKVGARELPPAEGLALGRWLDKGATRRE